MKPSELQHQIAEQSVAAYDSAGPRQDKVRKIFAAFPPGLKILDVGCASGAILAPFVGKHDLHGVDISESLAALAVKSGIKAVAQDLEVGPLPFTDKTFDALFCGESIEHYVNTDWVMSEINRVLKPGGRLVLTFPNVRTPVGLLMLLLLDLPPMYSARYRSPHFRDFTLRLGRLLFRHHGFSVDRCAGASFFLPKIGECGSWLAEWLPSWSSTIIMVGTKQHDTSYRAEDAVSEILG